MLIRGTVSILPSTINISLLYSNIIIPEWLRVNLGQIWRFAVIPWNPRWILLKGNGISDQLCWPHVIFSRRNVLFWRYFAADQTTFRICLFIVRGNVTCAPMLWRNDLKQKLEKVSVQREFRFRRVIFPCHFAVACSSVCSLSGFKAREGPYSQSLALPLCSPQSSVLRYWSTLEVERRKW